MIRKFIIILLIFSCQCCLADDKIVNIYGWDGYLSNEIIAKFEKETGITVNFSVFDSNLTLYTKLKTRHKSGYDIILPSSYFVRRMRHENMLQKINKSKLKNLHHIDNQFLNLAFDPGNEYSLPFLWGTTGIAINTKFFNPNDIQRWADLWKPEFYNQLLLLDDSRDVFTMAMLALGYPVNDTNPKHIEQAYDKLRELLPNVRLFNSMAIPNILIDGDVNVAMVWSGEAYLATIENPDIRYIYPKEGFAINLDCIAIPRGSPHPDNAHRFIDFILRPDIAKQLTMYSSYATPNKTALKLLPASIRNNPIIFPDTHTVARGHYQADTEKNSVLYKKYWLLLKLGAVR